MQTTIRANRHPKELYNLFFIELWERFGFYTVQALMVIYLTKSWQLSDAEAYDIYSAFSALIYATPVIGGYLADKFLGFRHAILLGTLIYIAGYFLLATPNTQLFFFGLALLICANGFFKSCISSLVGVLYEKNDPRKNSGFTIFYMGINIGSFTAPIISSLIAKYFGWGSSFAGAGIGMIFSLILALISFKHLGERGLPPSPIRLKQKNILGISIQTTIYASVILGILTIMALLYYATVVNAFLIIFSVLTAFATLFFTLRYKKDQRNKMFALIILIIFSMLFWALYMQIFSSVTLFNDRVLDRNLFGYYVPASMLSSVEAFFILLLSPVFATLWLHLGKKQPSAPIKFALGLILVGASFLILSIGTRLLNNQGLMPISWSILSYFLQTCGELCLSPIGLSIITTLAPSNLTGMMMGVWFLAFSGGFALGDYLAKSASITSYITNTGLMAHIYGGVFAKFALLGIGSGIILILLTPWIKKLILSH